jgi:hypothetical protein
MVISGLTVTPPELDYTGPGIVEKSDIRKRWRLLLPFTEILRALLNAPTGSRGKLPVGVGWVDGEVLSVPQLTSGQQGRCSDDSPDGLELSCQTKPLNQLASASSALAIKDRNHFARCSSSIPPEATASIVLTTGSSDAVIAYPFRSRNVSVTT